MKRKLLSLDQASKTTGWSVFEGNELITYGHITLNQEDIGERLVAYKKEIVKLINKYNINEIAFEDIQMQNNIVNNVHTFKVLAEIFGITLYICNVLKIDYTIVPSATWKSSLKIEGKSRAEQKRNAKTFIEDMYSISPTQDEADSLCIGTHILSSSGEKTHHFEEEGFDWN